MKLYQANVKCVGIRKKVAKKEHKENK